MKSVMVKIGKYTRPLPVIKENYHTFWVEFNGRHIKRKWKRDVPRA